jgi:hypothetical protein
MTQKQFRAALARLDIDQGKAAKLIGCTVRTVNGYANGSDIPLAVERLLALMLETSTPASRFI